MRRLTKHLSIAVLTILLSIGGILACAIQRSPKPELRVEIPDAKWVQIFFEMEGLASKSINELTKEANLINLRSVVLPDDDLEVRLWVGFGLNGVDGFILRRSSNQWTAIHLHGMADRLPFPQSKETLAMPRSGWEMAWQKLTREGILTLPDASAAGCNTHILDGANYVVEINKDKTYRTYLYDNPTYSPCAEAKQMLKIGAIVAEEFNLPEFKLEASSAPKPKGSL